MTGKGWVAVVALAAALGGPAGALVVTDDFNRADGLLGPRWTDYGSRFYLLGNWAVNLVAPGTDSVARINGVEVLDKPFEVQAAVYFSAYADEFAGLAFSIQDGMNYYFVRQMRNGGWTQVVKVHNGSYGSVFINEAFPWNEGAVMMKVSGNGQGTFTVTIGGKSVTFTDDTPLTGGGVGLYYTNAAGGGSLKWDNFAATFTPVTVEGKIQAAGFLGDNATLGVQVELHPAEGGETIVRRMMLETDGSFRIEDVPAGVYQAVVRSAGWLTARRTVTIAADPMLLEPIVLTGADTNGDDRVTFEDFSTLQNTYGQCGGTTATSGLRAAHAVDGILSAREWATLYSDPVPDRLTNGCVELARWGAEVRDGILYGAYELDPAGPTVAEFDTYPTKKLWLGLWIDADPAASPATTVAGGDDQFAPRVQDINIELGMDKGPLLGSPTWNSLNFWGRDNSFDNITPVTVNAAYQGHVVEFAVPVADIIAELALTDGVIPGNVWKIGARAAGHVGGEDYAGDITDLQSVTVFGIEGRVVLQSYQGDNSTVGVRCVLTPTGSGAPLTRTALLNADGTFRLDPVPAGTYNVSLKSSTSLSAVLSHVNVGTYLTDLGAIELANADINGDDEVSFGDFSILQNNYGNSGVTAARPLAALTGGCGGVGVTLLSFLGLACYALRLRNG